MNKKLIELTRFLLGLVGILVLIYLISFSVKNFLPKGFSSSYPPPGELPTTSVALPSETIIEQGPVTPIPINDSPFLKRETDGGWIIESGYSSYSSQYIFTNQWFGQIGDLSFLVLAGSSRSDIEKGGKELEKPWPSVLMLEAMNDKGERLPKESGEYRLPDNHGMLRIINADKENLLLVAEDGQAFSFNLRKRTFSRLEDTQTKTSSQGLISETGLVPYPSEKYTFLNYWSGKIADTTIIVSGGCMKDDPFQGVVVKNIVDMKNNVVESIVFLTPVKDGCVRIVDLAQENLIFVTMNGVALAFNPITNNFFDFSDGNFNHPFNEEELVSLPYEEQLPLDILGTGTPAPTYTPLPTPNPYP